MGLTKEVLSAHTQQEEQAFLDRFKDLSKLRVFDHTASPNLRCHTAAANPLSRGIHTHTTHTTRAHTHTKNCSLIQCFLLFLRSALLP